MRQTQQAKTTLSQPECMQSILGVYNQIEMICQGVQCALILILFLLPLSGLSFRLKRKKKRTLQDTLKVFCLHPLKDLKIHVYCRCPIYCESLPSNSCINKLPNLFMYCIWTSFHILISPNSYSYHCY